MIMKSRTYLTDYKRQIVDDWYRVKPGAGATVAQTTTLDELYLMGEIHDISVMDPCEILQRFEEYEDANFVGAAWVI